MAVSFGAQKNSQGVNQDKVLSTFLHIPSKVLIITVSSTKYRRKCRSRGYELERVV